MANEKSHREAASPMSMKRVIYQCVVSIVHNYNFFENNASSTKGVMSKWSAR